MSMQFRELVHPGTTYEFVGRGKLFLALTLLLGVLSIAMLPLNAAWRGSPLDFSIDFKGGTEIVVSFGKEVGSGDVRKAMKDAGHEAEVSSITFKDATGKSKDAYMVRVAEFGAISAEKAQAISDDFAKTFGPDSVRKARWSGDAFHIRTTKPVTEAQLKEFLAKHGLEMKAWDAEQRAEYGTVRPGTGEYEAVADVFGLDRIVQQTLAKATGTDVKIEQYGGVSAKAGEDLRNDGIRSTLYAIALIVLYIALRFDLRYGPASVAALLVNTVLTVGAFAITFQEFSLTTVAAVLTVIGYGINDTVVVFVRTRASSRTRSSIG
jgi:preprotein translocase subunit SecF